jgi:TRAP transporter 4TM/12TM fusion protein
MKIIAIVERGLEVAIPIVGIVGILDIPLYLTNTSLFSQQYLGLIWGFATALIFLTHPATRRSYQKGPKWYDVLAALVCFVLGLYVAICYARILPRLAIPSVINVMAGGLAVILTLESLRRIAGSSIVIIIVAFIGYAKLGYLAPGIMRIGEIDWTRLLTQLFLGADFMLGLPLRVAVLIVLGFILFGQVLFRTGGGQFFIEVAQSLMGRYRGGPAKVAVLASTIFGMLSGSSVANVASTGVITIPMMKRIGFSPAFAGAVEATASTGGILMPPVMGAAAFIMSEFLEVPYQTVVVAALVPALFYYFGIYMQVDLYSARIGLRGLPKAEIPSFWRTLRRGWMFLIPLGVIVLALFIFFLPPAVAALYSTGSVVLISFMNKQGRAAWNWRQIQNILRETTRAMIGLIAICAGAGCVVGIVGYTGLGLTFSRILTEAAGGSLLLLALLTGLASIVLGMGMPTTAAYILLAVLAAPSMVHIGVKPILAHLFVLYFGELSMLTPPVCLSAYAASSISNASPLSVALHAIRLAIAAYIVPFIFIYEPAIALIGTTADIALNIFLLLLLIASIAFAFEGYCLVRLRLVERFIFVVAAALIAIPMLLPRIIGVLIFFVLVAYQIARKTDRNAKIAGRTRKVSSSETS